MRFAQHDGYGGVLIVNLDAFRATTPHDMFAPDDPVGSQNDQVLANLTGTIVAGWGANARTDRVTRALEILPPLQMLGITKHGHPRHPFYVRANAPLLPWPSTTE